MRQAKKVQRQVFKEGETQTTPLPIWRPANQKRPREEHNVEETSSSRRETTDDWLLEKFNEEIERRLCQKIRHCIASNSDAMELFNKESNIKRLEQGVITNAEQSANLNAATIEKTLRKLNTRNNKTTADRWNSFVKQNFNRLLSQVEQENIQQSSSSCNPQIEPKPPVEEEGEFRTCVTSFNKLIRKDLPDTISRHLKEVINDTLLKASDYTIEYGYTVRNLMLIFSTATFTINNRTKEIDLAEKTGFRIKDLLPEGFPLQGPEFAPPPLDPIALSSPAFNKDFSWLFTDSFFQMVHSSYFGTKGTLAVSLNKHRCYQLMTSKVPRSQSVNVCDTSVMKLALVKYMTNFKNMWANPKKANKLLDRLLDILLRIHLAPKRERLYKEYTKKKAAEKIKKNKEKLEVDPKGAAVDKIHLFNKTRDQKRRLFKNEQKKTELCLKAATDIEEEYMKLDALIKEYSDAKVGQEEYEEAISEGMSVLAKLEDEKHKLYTKVSRCQERVDTYVAVLQREKTEKDQAAQAHQLQQADEQTLQIELEIKADHNPKARANLNSEEDNGDLLNTDDTPRKRLLKIRSCLKQILYKYHGSKINKHHIAEFVPDVTSIEAQSCVLICNSIMPYIPEKKFFFKAAYQLPFFLMANQVLKSTGYTKYCSVLSPLASPNKLLTLNIDAPTLFSIMCTSTEQRNLNIYGFDEKIIVSRQIATESKDAVFSSFFDLQYIQDLTGRYGFNFGHIMHIRPGLITANLVGTTVTKNKKENAITMDCTPSTISTLPTTNKNSSTIISNRGVESVDIGHTTTTVNRLNAELQRLYKERQENFLKYNLSSMKKKWIRKAYDSMTNDEKNSNTALYQEIEEVKTGRRKTNQKIIQTKQDIQVLKIRLYNQRQKTNAHYNRLQKQESIIRKNVIDRNSTGYIGKSENTIMNKNVLKQCQVSFSGTDNGLVTMTETVGFTAERFQFHLDLYNKYCVLEEELSADSEEVKFPLEFVDLPISHKIKSEEIDHHSGAKKERLKLQRDKHLKENKNIKLSEAAQSQLDFYNATDADIFQHSYDEFMKTKDESRAFYYKHSRMKNKRTYEIRKQRYIDQLCSNERSFASQSKQSLLVMFIGDRGHGYGSCIKGFRRYGGHWKQEKHALQTPVCVTNEHNTSQTCIFCYKKILHPLRRTKTKNGKDYFKTINGASQCVNPACISVLTNKATKPRDTMSSLAIGLSGLSRILFGATFPAFNHQLSHSNTDLFNHHATSLSLL